MRCLSAGCHPADVIRHPRKRRSVGGCLYVGLCHSGRPEEIVLTWDIGPALTLLGTGVVLLGYYLTARHQDAAAMRHATRARTSRELRDMLVERYGLVLVDDSDQSPETQLARSLDAHVLRDIHRYKMAIQRKGRTYKLQVFSLTVGVLLLLSVTITTVLSITSAGELSVRVGMWATVGLWITAVIAMILRQRWGAYSPLEFRPDE